MSSRQEDLEEENIGQEAYERALEVRNAKQEELDQAAAEKQEELVPLESVGATLAEEPIKDLIKQAIQHSIYRLKTSGKVYEGEYEVAMDEEELVKYLIDEDHQDDLLVLEKKLKSKKRAAV